VSAHEGLGRRKARLVRDEAPVDADVVLIRAVAADAVESIIDDASTSSRRYVIENEQGGREILYGVSVFALRPDRSAGELLARFDTAPMYLPISVGALLEGGFALVPTGSNPDHFDVQLLSARSEDAPASRSELAEAAARLVALAGPLRPNPAYT